MRSVLRSRTARAAVAAPVLLLVLAGCGGGEAAEPVAAEPATPETSTTVEVPSEPAAESPSETPVDTPVEAGEGSWDEETLVPAMMAAMEQHRTSHFRMSTSGGGVQVEAEGDMAFRGKQQDMAMTMSGATLGAESMEMRVVDGVVYLSMPPMTPAGKFFQILPGDESSPFAGMMDQMRVDPRDSVKAFEAGLREVTYLGEESVRGEDLERYRLAVDSRSAAKAQGLPSMQGMPETIDYDMWLDEDALLRRMELDVMQVTLVMEMSDWGGPVTIEAPARSRIVHSLGSANS